MLYSHAHLIASTLILHYKNLFVLAQIDKSDAWSFFTELRLKEAENQTGVQNRSEECCENKATASWAQGKYVFTRWGGRYDIWFFRLFSWFDDFYFNPLIGHWKPLKTMNIPHHQHLKGLDVVILTISFGLSLLIVLKVFRASCILHLKKTFPEFLCQWTKSIIDNRIMHPKLLGCPTLTKILIFAIFQTSTRTSGLQQSDRRPTWQEPSTGEVRWIFCS